MCVLVGMRVLVGVDQCVLVGACVCVCVLVGVRVLVGVGQCVLVGVC